MRAILTVFILLFSNFINACLWDRDTYAMEKQKFPDAFELMTGNFDRHSNSYYQWRIAKIQPQIDKGNKDPLLFDDLAVAYSKLGNDKKAIELMKLKEKFAPNLYETFANLGTFYIHDGQFEEGLKYINKAIKINPEAHFGREIYQKYLVEFILLNKKKESESNNFYIFLIEKYNAKNNSKEKFLPEVENEKAIKGVLGMMRFGNYNSPILLNALGDVLLNETYSEPGAKRLSAMAYMASDLYNAGSVSLKTKENIQMFLSMQERDKNTYEELLKEVKKGILIGKSRYAEIEKKERNWVVENKDLDVEFAQDFYAKTDSKNKNNVAQNNQNIYYAAQALVRMKEYTIAIPQDRLPTGILVVSILNTDYEPLSERLTFIKRKDDLKINLKPDLAAYSGRQKINFGVQTSGFNTAEGNYSVSVVNDSKVPVNEDDEITIYSSLLLNANLQGFIEKPNYYFHSLSPKKTADLDILMLTQGYSKFKYKDVATDAPLNITMLPEQSIEVSGVIRKSTGLPLENGRILFQIPDKFFTATGTTNKEGKFIFKNLVFRDSSDVIINARNNINSKDLKIIMDGEPFPAIIRNINAPADILNIDSTLNTYLKSSRIEHQSAFLLKEVVVTSTVAKKVKDHSDYAALSGLSPIADRVLPSTQLQGCAILVNCLGAAGLTYIENNLFLTRTYNQGLKVPIDIYVNGMQVDVNYLMGLDAKGVESIEVFYTDGLSGINRRNNTNGVLAINMIETPKVKITKEQLKELFPPTNVITIQPKGYAVERQFYVPKFSGPKTSLQREDYRTTIHWEPIVVTDKTGKGTFSFYNSDAKGPYRVTIEGVDANGNIGRTVYKYQLK